MAQNSFELIFAVMQLVEGRLYTSSYDGCLKVWDVSDLGNENDPNFKLRYPAKVQPVDSKDKDQTKEIEKFGGVGKLDSNQNHSTSAQEKIMIE